MSSKRDLLVLQVKLTQIMETRITILHTWQTTQLTRKTIILSIMRTKKMMMLASNGVFQLFVLTLNKLVLIWTSCGLEFMMSSSKLSLVVNIMYKQVLRSIIFREITALRFLVMTFWLTLTSNLGLLK
jgi:hypothetical protein